MQGEARQEPLKRMGSAGGEVGSEAIAAHIFHLVLVRQRRNSTCWIFAVESFVKEVKIGVSSADVKIGLLEGLKVGLDSFIVSKMKKCLARTRGLQASAQRKFVRLFEQTMRQK